MAKNSQKKLERQLLIKSKTTAQINMDREPGYAESDGKKIRVIPDPTGPSEVRTNAAVNHMDVAPHFGLV